MRDEADFVPFYRKEFSSVFRVTYLLCRDRAMAEDATQEAFARAFERWPRLRREPWAAGWVMTTGINCVRRMRRQHSRGADETFQVDVATSDRDIDGSLDLWRAVEMLPPREHRAVLLHYQGDLPVDQIAHLMRCGSSTVRAHLSRARQRLRDALPNPDAYPEGGLDGISAARDPKLGP